MNEGDIIPIGNEPLPMICRYCKDSASHWIVVSASELVAICSVHKCIDYALQEFGA